jgi:hypothetical protein
LPRAPLPRHRPRAGDGDGTGGGRDGAVVRRPCLEAAARPAKCSTRRWPPSRPLPRWLPTRRRSALTFPQEPRRRPLPHRVKLLTPFPGSLSPPPAPAGIAWEELNRPAQQPREPRWAPAASALLNISPSS